jgi:hypothetical protein
MEGALDELLVAPAGHQLTEHVARAHRRVRLRPGRAARSRPASNRHRLLAGGVRERAAERAEIEEVVGVQVTDQHRVDIDVLHVIAELGEHAVAAVEQQREVPLFD